MSATRRILAAGLPTVAVAVALAFSAAPALASLDPGVRPVVAAAPCAGDERTKCDYATPGAGATPGGGPTRGHAGYANTVTPSPSTSPSSVSPSPSPSGTTPSGGTDTVPATTPTGVQDTVTPTPSASTGGGVSAGSLPVTGPPMGMIVSLGALMVAGGAASVWYTRRRRSA